jgi:copper resistance protein C
VPRTALLATLVLVAWAWLLGPATDLAYAHATLTGSSPEPGSTLSVAPSQVLLEFDENVQTNFAVVNVIGPDGSTISTGDVSVTDNQVTAQVRPPSGAGEYTVAWRVVSDDGHPVDGRFTYTLTKRALSHTRSTGQVPLIPHHVSSSNSPWLTSTTGQLAIGFDVVVVGIALLWFERRRGR